MDHPSPLIQEVLQPATRLYEEIATKGEARLKIEGMLKDEKLITPTSRYYGKPKQYALDSFAYYDCFKVRFITLPDRATRTHSNVVAWCPHFLSSLTLILPLPFFSFPSSPLVSARSFSLVVVAIANRMRQQKSDPTMSSYATMSGGTQRHTHTHTERRERASWVTFLLLFSPFALPSLSLPRHTLCFAVCSVCRLEGGQLQVFIT